MYRQDYLQAIAEQFSVAPVVAILGPRQCGKTTLARSFIKSQSDFTRENYFDLEDSVDLLRLSQPKLSLEKLEGLIVIDEIQRIPELFSNLRVLVDQHKRQRFLILGSASKELIRQSSETLAGRIAYLELTPFSMNEVDDQEKLWIRGGFPLSYLADTEQVSYLWRKNYIKTFLEQDIPNLGIQIPAAQLSRFWQMVSHYNGNIFNASALGTSLNLSHNTVRNYLDILVGTFMLRELRPWYENIGKRQVKSPKIYFRDSGIFHNLLGITNLTQLLRHPKLGSSWECFVLEEVIRFHRADYSDCYFWATHAHAELDLLIVHEGKKLGFEFKYQDAPHLTKSMAIAMTDLQLDKLTVIYPGTIDYALTEMIEVKGFRNYLLQPPQEGR